MRSNVYALQFIALWSTAIALVVSIFIIKCHLLYSFLGVQNLLKKQEAVDAEITAHEQLINAVISTAEQLLERDHYAADEIEAQCAKLQDSWAELTSLSAARQQKLQDSLKAQQVETLKFKLTYSCLGFNSS